MERLYFNCLTTTLFLSLQLFGYKAQAATHFIPAIDIASASASASADIASAGTVSGKLYNPDDYGIEGYGVDEYGVYIHFYLVVASKEGPTSKIDGRVKVRYSDRGATFIGSLFDYGGDPETMRIRTKFLDTYHSSGGIRFRAENGTPANNAWSGFITVPDGDEYKTDGGAELTEVHIRWYIPEELIGKRLTILHSQALYIAGDYVGIQETTMYFDKVKSRTSKIFSPPLPDATFSTGEISANPDKMLVRYAYSGTTAPAGATVRHWLNDDMNNDVTDASNVKPTGTLDAVKSNFEQRHDFYSEFIGQGGHMRYRQSQVVMVPPYIWPVELKAAYDGENKVALSWNVNLPGAGTNFIDGDKFEVARSTDSTFGDITKIKAVGTIDYDPAQTHYETLDNLADLRDSTHVYYRVRRTESKNTWEWKVSVNAGLYVELDTILKADTVLLDETAGPKAIITWQPFKGVWFSGTRFTITKSNQTTGAAPQIINLDEKDARSGTYTDDNIPYCSEFTYSIELTFGGNFDSPPEADVPGSVLAVDVGTIKDLYVSKGYFPDRTELRWSAEGIFDSYIIKRRIYGSGDNFAQIATVPGTSANSDIQTDDPKGIPGVYYEYRVVGAVNCNNTTKYSKDTLQAVGFRSPAGTVYGRITYENGQAVENVAVRLESADNAQLGRSIYLNGEAESYLMIDSLYHPFSGPAFTVEAWIRPDDKQPVNQVIFSQSGQYELGFNGAGQLYFRYKNEVVTGAYIIQNQSFVHLAGVYGRDSLGLMLNDSLIAVIPCLAQPGGSPDTTVYIGRNANGNHFKGYIDEMRAWNIALDAQRVKRDYTRLMAGNEAGLAAYWRFDETIEDQFYDISNTSSNYHKNDGILAMQAVRSNVIPTPDQLSLKAYTDISGNYMISGIPYTGNGTTYAIVPLLGTHQFDPTSVNRLISSNSSEFTVNFVDKSSFPVSGYVYYQNSTVPVKGVQFMIDGKYAQKENGQIIETDALGKFSISVPVGVHEVKAVKTNHVFVNDGKITNRFGGNLNYQEPVSERILYDSTTVRFIGRVAGGVIQSDYPLGHSLSRNNLGENLSITMELAGAQNRKINASAVDSLVTVKHLLPSGQSDPSRVHRTRVNFQEYAITIYPDSVTGEFAVDLIPEDFNVMSVKATGHSSLNLPGNLPLNINLTNKFFVESEVHASDTVFYNYAYKFIERNKPLIDVSQVNISGNSVPFFGDTVTTVNLLNNQGYRVPVYDFSDGSYLFGYPVFEQNRSYRLRVSAYELYEYFEEDDPQNPVSTDRVPTQDGLVSIANDLRRGSNIPDTLSLNEEGEGIYQFQAGEPEISNGVGRKGLSVTVDIGGQPIPWNNGNKLEGYIVGWKKTGTDFITAGPNEIVRVLRDPPGSNSYAWFEEGTSTIVEKEYVGSVIQAGSEELKNSLGAATITFVGVGGGTINVTEAGNTYAGKLSHSETFTGKDKSTTVTKFLSRYQTSADPTRVGADADLFIGNSTNFTYGSTLELIVVKNDEVKTGSDMVFFDGAAAGVDYSIVRRTGINIAQRFGTHFVYTAKHIEDILIPGIVEIRNTLLLPVSTSPAAAQQRANSLKEEVYVSKLPPGDPNYGASNVDAEAFGVGVLSAPWGDGPSYKIYTPDLPGYNQTDTILALNQHIKGWKRELYENEKVKVSDPVHVKNFSFTGGGDVQYSEYAGITEVTSTDFNITLGAAFLSSIGVTINKTGLTLNIEEGLTTEQGGNFSDGGTEEKTFGFTFSESSVDYLSVDVLKAKDSTFVFKTKGGETACPYEGPTLTKYFQPGTTIDQPTMRAEAPDITVEKPVAADIPSTRNATFSLQLQNASETERGVSFYLQVMEDSNPDGAKIYMDGASLATGRAVWLNAGQVLQKTITLERGPEAMEYEDIVLRLISECDTTAFDLVNISAHFIPSCSDVHIQSPADNWLLNTQSPVNAAGERYLPLVIDEFDTSNSLFGYIGLQYKPLASSTWTSVVKFYADSASYEEAQGAKQLITGNEINYQLVMSDASFSDQQYEIRTVAVCMDNGQQVSTTASNVIRGTKDTYRPRLFGSPQPANGVLDITEDVRLNLNETIAAGLLSYPDFQVTGIRNGSLGDHSVSVRLDGQDDYLATEFNRNLEGKDITVEMWVLPGGQTSGIPAGSPRGTLFSHGNSNQSLELAFAAGNYLEVRVGETVVKSEAPLVYKPGEWAHVALVYNAAASTVSAVYNFAEVISGVPVTTYSGSGHFEFGRSIAKQGNYFEGAMHEARIWTESLTPTRLQANSLLRLSGAENGLLGYYPMTEGKGDKAFDKAHGAHAGLQGNWATPPGKAISFDGNGYLKLNTATAPVTGRMDYTMELWFKAEPGQGDAALASSGKGDGNDNSGSRSVFFLGFENGLLTYRNNGVKMQAEGNYLDNDWHHLAIAVNRNSGVAQFFVDGELNSYFDGNALGGLAAPFIYLGARGWHEQGDAATVSFDRHFKGKIDEFRLWNTYLNATLVSENSNVRLKGDELGLLLYYPFEDYVEFQNNQELAFSLADLKIQQDPATVIPPAETVNATETDDKAPVKDHGSVDNLQFDYVVNDDALIINLLEPRQAIDKTIVTFRVENLRDMNGNIMESPVTWTAYIDRNQLSWSDDEFTLSKELYAPMEFESYILNSGGSVQHFRLDNLPSWLRASPSSGTIEPQGREKIVFRINEGLNVGAYDEIIYMRNDDDETEALPVSLKVAGEEPDWAVDPADFDYSMIVYGKLRINGIFSANPDDILAAFTGGECVGFTRNVYNEANDLWYTFLTVYSNTLQHDDLEFRIWDAASGKTYQAVPSAGVSFSNDAIAGTAAGPILFEGREMVFQDIPLTQGWNWISFNLSSGNLDDIPSTLSKGQWQSGDIVKNEELGFHQYSSSGGWLGYLESFNNTSLFMLKAGLAQSLSIDGIPLDIAATPIPVKGGRWNYISYLPQGNMTVQEALAGYEASDEDVIKSQTGFAMYNSQTGWVGNLTFLEPGKGYMLYRKAANDVTFHYPAQGGILNQAGGGRTVETVPLRSSGSTALPGGLRAGAIQAAQRLNPLQAPVENNFYFAENMTVIAVLDDEFDLSSEDRVIAYVNGEVRGKAAQVTNPLNGKPQFFINIAGDENAPVYFEIERQGRIVARSATTIAYRSDSRAGTVDDPLVIRIENEHAEITMYPNPFGRQLTISGEIRAGGSAGGESPGSQRETSPVHEVQLLVYDVTGAKVLEGPPQRISGNNFRLTWDGRNMGGQVCLPGVYFIHVLIDGRPLSGKVIKVDSPK
ncbi:concanavalin A-like lectin/glucanase superfamily protein [Anseongella ginsenosidimutans]|uniref:Concanavalin A-like lectin/glucanase superfamily protein n=1 Tax=Anseongella ginsenosidimutans TaxID=496056 RepID=A0A4R3KPG1_9SPHI|nr:LamG domain-containing protein [Anseongella ginsenosidimutans]QEC52643.1 LamG domain-containing protein [Anseongella ginsenosidimutans]TCS86568.1 concanavalin A-like lectin/glucanase superfamily protein [Anseongella ginsenosidimutans]